MVAVLLDFAKPPALEIVLGLRSKNGSLDRCLGFGVGKMLVGRGVRNL